jgi:hypothetical protein
MEGDTFLSWKDFRTAQAFVTDELNVLGFQVALSDWEEGQMMWDNLEFSDGTNTYSMFISIRRPFSFGFGLTRNTPEWKNIFNQTVPFDTDYQNSIRTLLKMIKE